MFLVEGMREVAVGETCSCKLVQFQGNVGSCREEEEEGTGRCVIFCKGRGMNAANLALLLISASQYDANLYSS